MLMIALMVSNFSNNRQPPPAAVRAPKFDRGRGAGLAAFKNGGLSTAVQTATRWRTRDRRSSVSVRAGSDRKRQQRRIWARAGSQPVRSVLSSENFTICNFFVRRSSFIEVEKSVGKASTRTEISGNL